MGLHVLPEKYRILYKIIVRLYKIMNNIKPNHLSNLIKLYRFLRFLKSGGKKTIDVPTTKLAQLGGRFLHSVAPELWNALPSELKAPMDLLAFKPHVKSILCKMAHSDIVKLSAIFLKAFVALQLG